MPRRRILRRCAPFALPLLLAACGGSDSDKDEAMAPSGLAEARIGPSGGTVASSDGLMTLSVPAGALAADTTITVERVSPEGGTLMYYELLPSGLQFQLPATMTVDVSAQMAGSSAADLDINTLPAIVTTTADGQALTALDTLSFAADADAGTFTLSGTVSHFSRFAIGGDLNMAVGVENVPQFAAPNAEFGPVQVVIERGEHATENIFFATYTDSSLVPVLYGEDNPFNLVPLPGLNASRTYPLRYACGDPGQGTFRTALRFVTERVTGSRLVIREGEVDIANAFLFGITGEIVEEDRREYIPIRSFETYNLTGVRQVDCSGTPPVEDDGGGDTVGGGGDPGGGDTGGGDSGGGDSGGGTATAPTISTATSQITIDHIIGTTGCPTAGEAVTIVADTAQALSLAVSESLDFLTVSPTTTTLSGGSAQFIPSFPCSGFQVGANAGVVTVTATDPATQLGSNTLQIPVVVNVSNGNP